MSFGIGNPYKTGGQSFTVQGQGFAQGTVGFVQLEGINYPVGFQLEANKSHHKDHNHHNHHHHKEHHHQTDNHFYPQFNRLYRICPATNLFKCMSIHQGHHHKNQLQIDEYHGTDNQKYMIYLQNGRYHFKCYNGGVIHIPQSRHDNNVSPTVALGHNSGDQYFELIPATHAQHGKVYYIKTFCGKALDLKEGHVGNHSHIVQYDYHGGFNQMWVILAA